MPDIGDMRIRDGPAAGTSSAPAGHRSSSNKPPEPKPLTLAEENAILRRENTEIRQQLLQLVAAAATPPAPPPANAPPLPAAFWLEAQLRHSKRQVQLLSDALTLKAEITADLEVVLLQLRNVENGPPATWCRDALRRIRSVNFAEDVGETLKEELPRAPPTRQTRASASGGTSRASAAAAALAAGAGPGAAAARRGRTTVAGRGGSLLGGAAGGV